MGRIIFFLIIILTGFRCVCYAGHIYTADSHNTICIEDSMSCPEHVTVRDCPEVREAIRKALEYQRVNYPASQYRDVYKNFMQDFFGPGHILKSTEGAERYLKSEMNKTVAFDGPLYEPTGFLGNFYRVNIGLVKDGTIPYDQFFDAFVKSVSGITPPEPEYWMSVWKLIDEEIGNIGWHFENETADRKDLGEQFEAGDYIVHHSKAYNDAVNFHYRIISRDLFETVLKPYIDAIKR